MLKVTRADDGDVTGVDLTEGQNIASITQQHNGSWLIQTNFNDFYEQRMKLQEALGLAASMLVEVTL